MRGCPAWERVTGIYLQETKGGRAAPSRFLRDRGATASNAPKPVTAPSWRKTAKDPSNGQSQPKAEQGL